MQFSNVNRRKENLFAKSPALIIVMGVLSLLSSCILSAYLKIAPLPLIRSGISVLTLCGLCFLQRRTVKRVEVGVFAFFSLVISIILVLGYHIHVESGYSGTINSNYITPYTWYDMASLLLMLPSLTILFLSLYYIVVSQSDVVSEADSADRSPNFCKRWFVIFLALFFCWLPYLLAYWPGIILGDTTSSINQALNRAKLNNHFPVLYTLFIKVCMKLGRLFFDSNTVGYGLYTISQMLYVSACIAYMISWVWEQAHVRPIAGVFMVLFFGLTPHFAAFSIAGWKDPVFSASIAAVTVYLLDDTLYLTRKRKGYSRILYLCLLLMIAFSRNNGIGVIVFIAAWQIAVWVYHHKKGTTFCRAMPILTIMSILIYSLISGPVYSRVGIVPDKRESNALVLQQMARVAALDGDMSESDREFLNDLFPIELYKEHYRPCCIDMLKWDKNFNTDALTSDMYKHWLSLFIKNPVVYFEAWELNSFGFWTLNVPDINANSGNIAGGVPRNLSKEYIESCSEKYGIHFDNLLGFDGIRALLPMDEWSLPLGWIFWGAVFVCICICLSKQFAVLIAFVPTMGLMIPLFFFTPIYYWVRYGMAIQYLIPVYVLLVRAKAPFVLHKDSDASCE